MKKAERLSRTAAERAYELLKAKDRRGAHDQAARAAWLDPRNEDAWLILAATSSPSESVKYLKKALALNPDNPKAKAGMEWAERKLRKENAQISLPQILEESGAPESNTEEKNTKTNGNRIWRRAFKRWQSILSIGCVAAMILVAIFAPLLAPVDENAGSQYYRIACDKLRCSPEAPSQNFPLGTVKEYDVLHTLIWGFRQALIFGLTAAVFTALIGITLGAVAAFSGGWFDSLIMRICDGFLAFPIIAAVAMLSQVIAYLNPNSWGLSLNQYEAIPTELNLIQSFIMDTDPVLLALVLFSWMPYARLMHAQVLQVKKKEYVDAARLLGVRKGRIIFRHILPNALSPVIVMLTRDIGRMVVLQASLTYIGVADSSAWASLLTLGKEWIIGPGGNLLTRWWIYLPITLAIVFFGASWNLLGDEVNIWLNPRNALISKKEMKMLD
jgi:peptide/nickel transport system permease protein